LLGDDHVQVKGAEMRLNAFGHERECNLGSNTVRLKLYAEFDVRDTTAEDKEFIADVQRRLGMIASDVLDRNRYAQELEALYGATRVSRAGIYRVASEGPIIAEPDVVVVEP
jgi:hypothetical protein